MNWDHESGSGNLVSLQTCDGSPAQSWYFDASDRIHSSVDDTKCLQANVVSVGNNEGSVNVVDCEESLSQAWVNDGSDRLQDKQYDYYLGVGWGCGGVEPGRGLQMQKNAYGWDTDGIGNCLRQQQWIVVAAPAPPPAPTNQPTDSVSDTN